MVSIQVCIMYEQFLCFLTPLTRPNVESFHLNLFISSVNGLQG